MKMIFAALCLMLTSSADALSSQHLKNFRLEQCQGIQCFRSKGDIAFIALSGNSLSANNVNLEVSAGQGAPIIHHCSTLRFNLLSQLLICDNQAKLNQASFTIDSDFKMQTYH